MAGDKKKVFSVNPFRDLKGFSVSDGGKNKPAPPPAMAPKPAPESEPDIDFAGEMMRIGVKRGRASAVPPVPPTRAPEDAVPAMATDEELFRSAIGQMESTFNDELPEALSAPPMPRLKKLLRNERFVPDDELDLHGLDRLRAQERVRFFLENAIYQGKKTVLLITGRGHGSTGEPVLRSTVADFLLRDSGLWVSEWAPAPRRFGGDGAFIVILRGEKKE